MTTAAIIATYFIVYFIIFLLQFISLLSSTFVSCRADNRLKEISVIESFSKKVFAVRIKNTGGCFPNPTFSGGGLILGYLNNSGYHGNTMVTPW